jgi:hypothetical protein
MKLELRDVTATKLLNIASYPLLTCDMIVTSQSSLKFVYARLCFQFTVHNHEVRGAILQRNELHVLHYSDEGTCLCAK